MKKLEDIENSANEIYNSINRGKINKIILLVDSKTGKLTKGSQKIINYLKGK